MNHETLERLIRQAFGADARLIGVRLGLPRDRSIWSLEIARPVLSDNLCPTPDAIRGLPWVETVRVVAHHTDWGSGLLYISLLGLELREGALEDVVVGPLDREQALVAIAAAEKEFGA